MNHMRRNTIVLLAMAFIFALTTSVCAQSITIKASASPKKGGSISPSGKVAVIPGDILQFTITPNTGYQIKDVLVDGISQGAVHIYTFTNVTEKHSIKAKFAKKTFTVKVAEGGKVTVSPVGTKTVAYGKKINLKIKPESEDVVPILLVNGQPVEAVKSGNGYKYVLIPTGDTSVYATSEVEPVLLPTTKVMDETTLQNLTSVSDDSSVLTFTGVTPYLESLQTDDVIVVNTITDLTPYGLFRKVTSVTINNSQATVETTDATLEDAIEEAEIIIEQALEASNITSFVPLIEGVSLREALPGPLGRQACLDLHNVFYDADGNEGTTHDQIALNGSVCLDPTFRCAIGIKIDWWPIPRPVLKNLVFATGLSESIALELVASYTYSFSREVPIATINFPAISAGWFTFFPVLTLYVGIDGSLSAGITASVTQNASLEVGLQYSHGDWSSIHTFTRDFGYSLPSLSTLSAQAQIYAKPQFEFLLYGIAGPYANIKGYFEVIMDPLSDPWLTLWAGLQAGVGVKAKLLSKTVFDRDISLPDISEKIAEVGGNKPPSITSFTASRTSVFTWDTSTVTLVASDPENDPLTCTWSATGGSLSSTTGCGSVTWTAPGTPGTHSVSVSVTDNWPGHSSVSRSVNITVSPNLPPTITSLTPASPSVILGGSTTVTLVASDPENDPLTCTWSATGGSLSSTTGCGSVTWTAPGTPGTHSVSVSVTDNRPGHSPATMSRGIDAIPIPGCVVLTSPANYEVLDNGCTVQSNVLEWDFAWSGSACSGPTQYNIQVYHPQSGTTAFDTTVNTTSYHHESASPVDNSRLADWRWRVRAMVNGFWSEWSLQRSFDVEQVNTDCNQPPIISSLTANPDEVWTGRDSIITEVSSDPEGNPLTCTWSASGGSLSSNSGCGSVTWRAPGTPGTYSVTVNVTDNRPGHSPVSRSVDIRVVPIPLPGTPTGLSATDGVFIDRIGLTWTAPTTGGPPTFYRVYRHTSNDPGAASVIATPSGTFYEDHVEEINTYWYWVRACNSSGMGPYSNGDSGYIQAMNLTVQALPLPFPSGGDGLITGPGISCGTVGQYDCSEQYRYNTSVTLTATTASINEWLQSWEGCDSTSGDTCTVLMNRSRTVTGWFERYSPP